MKLELKHLASYLPYGLKIAHFDSQFKNGFEVHTLNGLSENYRYREEDLDEYDDKKLLIIKEITFWFNRSGLNSTAHNVKPILRPLSDLTKEIEVNREKFIPLYKLIKKDKAFTTDFINAFGHEELKVSVYELLLEWHFDIFGLIEQDLVIDVNTLTE